MDYLINDNSKYGIRMPAYRREDSSVYVKIDGRVFDRDNPDDVRALRAHVLDAWRPVDDAGQALYRRMAAQPDSSPWTL